MTFIITRDYYRAVRWRGYCCTSSRIGESQNNWIPFFEEMFCDAYLRYRGTQSSPVGISVSSSRSLRFEPSKIVVRKFPEPIRKDEAVRYTARLVGFGQIRVRFG
jgi:hypothetical protein